MDTSKEVAIPEGVSADFEGNYLVVKGPKGELKKLFKHPRVKIQIDGDRVLISSKIDRRKANAMVGTFSAHLRNMIKGVTRGFETRLKIVYSHFPVKVTTEGDRVLIGNFMGEKKPRVAKLTGDVKVDVQKDEIVISGIDRESVGQSAANIELATKVTGYDKRVFQDGIYILGKPTPIEEVKDEKI